jgi:hypothetical protein
MNQVYHTLFVKCNIKAIFSEKVFGFWAWV